MEFRYGQYAADPRDGLALFGPYDGDSKGRPKSPAYVLLSTQEGIERFKRWGAAMNRPAYSRNKTHQIWPPFPGFQAAFDAEWAEEPVWTYSIDREKLLAASQKADAHERCYEVVDIFMEGFKQAKKLDESIGVAICVIPDEVWKNCRPKSRVANPVGSRLSYRQRKSRIAGQLEMFDQFNPEQYQLSPDFRRQLKARTMQFDIPLQIIRESTLRLSDTPEKGERDVTPLSDRMWNISTTLYYKCGGKPWRLATARDGVCYIGLAFRRSPDDERTACCAAQMFLNTGDGIVFLGEYGPWYSPETNQCHLDKKGAKDLLKGILDTYKNLGGKELTEIFLHSRSEISAEEFSGFQEVCPPGSKVIGVRVRQSYSNGPRLFRAGEMPVLRGTYWKINERSSYLFGSGFKPRLGTYDGWEFPVPLKIDIQHGEASIDQVTKDIFGLTKLNYNACRLGDSGPVTVGFSDAVGEILISNPTVSERRANFKFYI